MNACEPYTVRGGPFDFKVERRGDTIILLVTGDQGDLLSEITFNASRIGNVIDALRRAQAEGT